ncbi:winged helix DNA-binding domain-containing protein [Paenibacillus guangzhouensis]|uniref:winged helix DNA-binding domain-containing protein n=1 Tax=Paenibacillus guangzhouensis TaxID=1473112 RepID=UPI001266C6BD|nr:winged helix DNA-binding domain-containing protein [Paenibacillus guangzhouensis]
MQVLHRRALNRALLARQLLLERSTMSAYEAIEHLAGMQSQVPSPPYFGLWSRLRDFHPEDLSSLISSRRVVRMGLMRSTIHLVTDQDSLAFRPVLQPMMDRGLQGSFGRQLMGADLDEIAEVGRHLVEEQPRTLAELGKVLQTYYWPDHDAAALANAVRNKVPLVQVPPRGLWGKSGSAKHTSVESWLHQPLAASTEPDAMILRYLAAFGPASVKDMQIWSGLTKLREAVSRLEQLITFEDEHGNVLYDLPGAPRPAPDIQVPVRFLGEFDNMLLSYADRSRIMSDEYRTRVFTDNGIIRSTLLIDGFVQGVWRLECKKKHAILAIEPFIPITADIKTALMDEGAKLLSFAARDAAFREIQGI